MILKEETKAWKGGREGGSGYNRNNSQRSGVRRKKAL
jgi:hypothetical protein